MKKLIIAVTAVLYSVAFAANSADKPTYYGTGLCSYPQYECIKVGRGQSWKSLFPDERERDLVQRVNRTYNHLWYGKTIAVPKNLSQLTLLDIAPFPHKITTDEKQIIVDQEKLAWGAYDDQGHLLNWGPISSGSDRCSDNSSPSCRTKTGIFRIFSKENKNCQSNMFPVGRGGAKMPYCMYFHKGFAMHGSNDIPGRRASHGCVRMFVDDALWLNREFVELSNESNQNMGTKVIVRPLND
tara:strand:- start:2596 stop:3318 length:723 start_codon:yes stop_codon:yes gene_type:complete